MDVPGFAVARPAEGAALLAQAGAPNAGLQYDIYHAAMMGEDPVEGLARFSPVIRHVQFADAPGRHEPGTGRVDIAGCFARLDALGYAGLDRGRVPPLEGHHRDPGLACLRRRLRRPRAVLGWLRPTPAPRRRACARIDWRPRS